MASRQELEERICYVENFIDFGKNMVNNLTDREAKRVTNNILIQLKYISEVYRRAINLGEILKSSNKDKKYSIEDLRTAREREFAELKMSMRLSEKMGIGSEEALEAINRPEILAYGLLIALKNGCT